MTNLNRQFLFRKSDVGSSKAETAAKFINSRIPGANVTPHFCKIQDKDADFFQSFHIIVLGLDSLEARRWINDMICSFVQYEEELKSWDHACGLICVSESGGAATDAEGGEVLFAGRQFRVKGGVVCTSRWATPEMRKALSAAAARQPVTA